MVRQYEDDYYYDDPVEEHKPANRSWMVSLSLATILALIVIGDTIGGLVTVNNRTHIEFGQGVVLAVPCDSNGLTVKPVAEYRDNNGSNEFLFDSLFLSNISDQCLNKLFQFKFYTLSGSSPIVIGEKLINPSNDPPRYPADVVRFLLSRTISSNPFDAGLDWTLWRTATSIGNPPNSPTFPTCGGSFNIVNNLDVSYQNSEWPYTLADCLNDAKEPNNILSHFQGFITVPGTDGSEVDVDLTTETYGNSQLWIDGMKVLSINTENSTTKSSTITLKLRKGQSYTFDYWVLKNEKPLVAKLYWNLDTNGNPGTTSLVPDSAFSTDYLSTIKIAPTEGTTDYSVASTSSVPNARGIKIQFVKPIPSAQIQFLTLETF